MATLFPGMSFMPRAFQVAPSGYSVGTYPKLALTADRRDICGRVWFAERTGTKNISRIGFRFGPTVTKAGGSIIRVALEDVDNTTGSPMKADGTQDQYVDVPNADMVASAWYRTNALTAQRTVNFGDLLAVTFQFDGGGRLGADSIDLAIAMDADNASHFMVVPSGVELPNITIEFDDATIGTLFQSFVWSDRSVMNISNVSSPDEIALEFGYSRDTYIDGANVYVTQGASLPMTLTLYDEHNTVLAATTVASKHFGTMPSTYVLFSAAQLLSANTLYRMSVTTTGVSLNVGYVSVAEDTHWACHPGGASFRMCYRTAAGAWTRNRLRRPIIMPLVAGW